MSSGAKAATTISGIALASAGLLVAQSDAVAVDGDYDGVNDTGLDDNWELPGLMMAVGLAMTFAGLTAKTDPEDDHVEGPKLARPQSPISSVVMTQPMLVQTPAVVIQTPAAAIAAEPPAALPELPADEPTLRIAKQIRVAASTGRCENAWLMWRQLTVQAPEYAGAIATGPVLAPCRR